MNNSLYPKVIVRKINIQRLNCCSLFARNNWFLIFHVYCLFFSKLHRFEPIQIDVRHTRHRQMPFWWVILTLILWLHLFDVNGKMVLFIGKKRQQQQQTINIIKVLPISIGRKKTTQKNILYPNCILQFS